jgi:hypothetical protein
MKRKFWLVEIRWADAWKESEPVSLDEIKEMKFPGRRELDFAFGLLIRKEREITAIAPYVFPGPPDYDTSFRSTLYIPSPLIKSIKKYRQIEIEV